MIEEKGEELLLILSDTLNKLNQSVHSKASKTLDGSSRVFSLCNQLHHKIGRFLVNPTSATLSKLADVFKK